MKLDTKKLRKKAGKALKRQRKAASIGLNRKARRTRARIANRGAGPVTRTVRNVRGTHLTRAEKATKRALPLAGIFGLVGSGLGLLYWLNRRNDGATQR